MNWLRRMMYGRYGSDQLNVAMLVLSIALLLVSRLLRIRIFSWFSFILLVLCYLRMFSRNITRRHEENQKFLRYWFPMRERWYRMTDNLRDCRTHRHFKCRNCGQKLRVPRGRGKVSITCPRCGNQFLGKT